ncbi:MULTISPECIES: hypothetical protein [unclassified Tolypothrix]|uniref:hypothetical protein n=1 Tax=unclassified Tolypothrix TaxID=2649714 RepID=UPI0005EAA442|nr:MULTISPECIES: hypothetical protein [unclassified Tolypothrix]EKF04812.1 hypothetical protein FDUTEX481_00971 [Tolypothrix sp. PCC 7601]BAY91997.1 hypothetical protein NIES3275_40280 [Microchaete diplosiphon NIES-3275]
MERPRVMVIGSKVTTVQRVSRYCMTKDLEVFPYYGVPLNEEITLFNPHVFVLCQPLPEGFVSCIDQPYILWSEQTVDGDRTNVKSPSELSIRLQELLQI